MCKRVNARELKYLTVCTDTLTSSPGLEDVFSCSAGPQLTISPCVPTSLAGGCPDLEVVGADHAKGTS